MIARVWQCSATAAGADHYFEFFNSKVRPQIQHIDGFIGARLLRRTVHDIVEIAVMTEWESLDAVRSFAGEDLDRAVVEPEAMALLLHADPRVRNFEVVE